MLFYVVDRFCAANKRDTFQESSQCWHYVKKSFFFSTYPMLSGNYKHGNHYLFYSAVLLQ